MKDFSFGSSRLRQPEANASIGKHVGLLVAPVKSKDRAQAKVMTDYKEDQAAGNLATFETCFPSRGRTITYPLPAGTLESMIFRRSHGGICDCFLEGIGMFEIFERILKTSKYLISSIILRQKHAGFDRRKQAIRESEEDAIPTV